MISHSKPWIIEDDLKAVSHVLSSGMIDQGEHVRFFEVACAQYLGVSGGVAMGSGTAALTLALRSLDLKPDSEVILPTYVCKNVADAVLNANFVPVLCDVGDCWNMTSETVAKAITKQTGAIIVVHLFGIPAPLEIFEKFDLPIIEDACQAFGAKIGNRMLGTISTIGVFSFHATKCFTTGEGGLVISDDPKLLKKMRMLRDGQDHPTIRLTSPISDLQAALGLSQLSRYNLFLQRRRFLADHYFEALAHSPLGLPDAIRTNSIFFRFPVRFEGNFKTIQKKFLERGIHVRQGVDALLHHLMDRPPHSFPNAEHLHQQTVSLPIYPALTDKEQETIIDACWNIFG